tara:strand:- start:526 stop:1059 length:534 start_codon:yes stop_codon:yes gene_type:complete
MFDLNKYSEQIANAQPDRVDRDWIDNGTHIIRIEGCEALTGANTGRDMVILEGEIRSTDSETQRAGDKVKHIFSLSGVEAWKVQRNLQQLKSVVAATLPEQVASAITPDVIKSAVSGGADAVVCGADIKIIAKQKESKNGKTYLSFSFMRAPTVTTASGWTVTETTEAEANSDEIPF